MKDFFNIRQELTEAKVTVAKPPLLSFKKISGSTESIRKDPTPSFKEGACKFSGGTV